MFELNTAAIVYIVIESIIGLISILGNGFILYIFACEERLRKKRNYYLMSLAFSDFLLAILGIPTTVMARFSLPEHASACMWSLCILDTTRLINIYSITAISIDRLRAVYNPVEYRNDTSNSSTLYNILHFWIFAIVLGFLPLFGWNLKDERNSCTFYEKIGTDYLGFFTIIGIVIPLIIIVISYSIIIVIIRRISKSSRASHGGSAQSREVTATIRISIIVGIYILCELPIIIVNIVNSASDIGLVTDIDVVHGFLALAHVHTAINPFLYAFNMKEFKEACKKVLRIDLDGSSFRSSST